MQYRAMPTSLDEIDAQISVPPHHELDTFVADGRADLADALLATLTEPDLAEYACRRFLAQAMHSVRVAKLLNASCVWIAEIQTDMINLESFRRLSVPFIRELTEEVRRLGMKSIFHFHGNPEDKWEEIFSSGADAVGFEESKKNFTIDVAEVVKRAKGRCAVMGNLDAIGILQRGTRGQLEREISRQAAAGRENAWRFIMNTGSPVTPETPVAKVKLYSEMTRTMGRN